MALVRSSRRTTWLTLDCLHLYLAHFRQLRPDHPAEEKKSFRSRPVAYKKNYLLGPWESKPSCQWPKVTDLGLSTAKEETCVGRVIWLLQLHGDINKVAACSKLNCPAQDIEAFRQASLKTVAFYLNDPLQEVQDYLREAAGGGEKGGGGSSEVLPNAFIC
ncbi:hypothetical protein PG988_001123 [Apiospora saccharicola]